MYRGMCMVRGMVMCLVMFIPRAMVMCRCAYVYMVSFRCMYMVMFHITCMFHDMVLCWGMVIFRNIRIHDTETYIAT